MSECENFFYCKKEAKYIDSLKIGLCNECVQDELDENEELKITDYTLINKLANTQD